MSKQKNQELGFWTDVLNHLRRIPGYRGEIRLTDRDNETLCQVIVMNCLILKDTAQDASLRSSSNLKRWCINTKRLNVEVLDQVMKDTIGYLRRIDDASTYDRFKHDLSYLDSQILGAFMAPVRDYLEGFLLCPSSSSFAVLNQFLCFMARTSLMDVDFAPKMLEEYYSNESRLSELTLPTEIMVQLNLIMTKWLAGFELSDLAPRHGKGSTAELPRTTHHRKYGVMRVDRKLQYLMKSSDIATTWPTDPVEGLDRTARVTFVRKSLSTMRTICKEPTSLMYYQEACWDQIQNFIESHPFLGRRIDFRDQSRNRKLAERGSRDGSYATIDLSAASDSVSWELVKQIFAGTGYYKACLLTRSTRIALPNGDVITPEKFAPMGSALCFPTECLVFCVVCEYVAQLKGYRSKDSYSIYGDDIAIVTPLASDVISVLSMLGFVVNLSKSFTAGRFRESCGGEYYDGDDVAPIRIPRNFEGRKITSRTPGLFTLHLDLCNEMYGRKLWACRAFLIRKFFTLPRSLLPLFDQGERGLVSNSATNFHLLSLINTGVQACYFVFGEAKSIASTKRADDEISLFIWHFRAMTRRPMSGLFPDPSDVIIVESDPPKSCLKSTKIYDVSRSQVLAEQRIAQSQTCVVDHDDNLVVEALNLLTIG